jgi:pectate lyase
MAHGLLVAGLLVAGLVGCGSDSAPATDADNLMGSGGSGSPAANGGSNASGLPGAGGSNGEAPPVGAPLEPPPPPVDCDAPPPEPSELIGWASEGTGTTGGGDLEPTEVDDAGSFREAIGGDEPRVIHLRGSLQGRFEVGSNKTVVGVCGAQIQGHVRFDGSSNSILRNLRVLGNNCTDSPNDCSGGADAIGVTSESHHLWFDHLDVLDGSDGNLDITEGSDFVTISWTKFSYSSRRTDPEAGASGHRFSNLIGGSDDGPLDPGRLNVTYHHVWWADNIDQRMPRTRRGQIHVFNNLYTSVGNGYCTDAGFEARLLVQNNVYIGVNRPLEVRDGGDMRAEGNVFQNTTGNQDAAGTGFTPPYAFELEATAGLEAAIRAGVGPH